MSYVLFSDGDGSVEVSGRERHYGRHLAMSLGFSCLNADELAGGWEAPVRSKIRGRRRSTYVGGGVYEEKIEDLLSLPVGPGFTEQLRQEIVGFRERIMFEATLQDGATGRITPDELLLNTAVVAGSDAVALLTRIHAHCEVHAWVDGADREWLAGVVEAGREGNVLRPGGNWEELSSFLRAGTKPVVMSASIGDTFPTQEYAQFDPTEVPEHAPCVETAEAEGCDPFELESCTHEDAWYDLSNEERWERALRGLQERPVHERLQISPLSLHQPMFAPYLTAFDVAW